MKSRRFLAILLSLAMVLTLCDGIGTPVQADGAAEGELTFEQTDDSEVPSALGNHADELDESDLTAASLIREDGTIRVSIVLEKSSTIGKGFATKSIGTNATAVNYRTKLLKEQQALAERISEEALDGATLDVVWNLTLAANIISAYVPYARIRDIEAVAGVKEVVIETQYSAPDPETADEPQMASSTYMTGENYMVSAGYTGAGSIVAIIDTGLDTDHQSFNADAFDYAIAETGKDVDLLTADEVAELYSQLNFAAENADYTADDVSLSTKIPYAANYVDGDVDVTHDNDDEGAHGSHVTGIAAANRYIETSEGVYEDALEVAKTQGDAPDAQILVMKVFGKNGGAYDSDYMAAIEDAIILGADAVNLSLGSSVAGMTTSSTYQDIMDSLEDTDTVVVMSAGNNSSWADNTYYGYLYWDDANFDTVGSPGSYTNSFAVASADNAGETDPRMIVDGTFIYYFESTGYGNVPIMGIAGDYEYILIDSIGTEKEFAALADVLEGKIAVCSRGTTSFIKKANAAVANGAVATIIYNNTSGAFYMNLDGYNYTAPAVAITQSDAQIFRDGGEKVTLDSDVLSYYYTGTITVCTATDASVSYGLDTEYYSMSDFSSWGVPGDLSLKPEITAPGGNIFSVDGTGSSGTAYVNMSGTSMAAPQITGLTATLAEYIRENDLTDVSGLSLRQLATSLLMSTAVPLVEEDSGYYYSVLKQGSGLVNVLYATQARSYVLMDESATVSASDGKVKAELGDDPDRSGVYTIAFTLNNLTDEDVAYDLSAEFFTQDLFGMYTSYFTDTWLAPLAGTMTWTVDGETYEPIAEENLPDFNGDGIYDVNDAVTLLRYAVGGADSIENEDLADLDGDGDIDTYDAYLALADMNDGKAVCPANGSIEVVLTVDLGDALSGYDVNGAYVEGYIFADETSTEEGVTGVSHSIPVLGYYGSWTEPSMFDRGSYVDYVLSQDESSLPYMYYYYYSYYYSYYKDSEKARQKALETVEALQTFLVNYSGESGNNYFGGNPVSSDTTYHEERNALSGENILKGIRYTAIRNYAGSLFTVTDGDGSVLFEREGGAGYAAYSYTTSDGVVWYNTYSTFSANYSAADLEDGTGLTFSLTLAPEYYVGEDGTIDWDALGEGATRSISAVVDSTDPTVDKVTYSYEYVDVTDEDTGETTSELQFTITITATDNQYIAGIFLYDENDNLLGSYGSDESDTAEAGATNTYEFTMEDASLTHLYVQVYDYAANTAVYKINTNISELFGDKGITLDKDSLLLIVSETAALTASVTPWGVKDGVTWSSSDESVATVDENGTVTAVAAGTATITAVPAADTSLSASCEVTVKEISETLNAVVWDENGSPWFSSFVTNELPAYTKLTESASDIYFQGVAVDDDLTTYAVSYYNSYDSILYTVDENYEAEEVALDENGDPVSVGIAIFDLSIAPSLGNYLVGVYAKYLLLIDTTTGKFVSYFNLSNYIDDYLVGIAYCESFTQTYYNQPVDWYYLVDASGNLYETGLIDTDGEGSISRFGVYDDGNLGYSTDAYCYCSLYYQPAGEDEDYGKLFWSMYSTEDSDVYMLYYNMETGNAVKLSTSEYGVWPFAGLYEQGVTAYAAPESVPTGAVAQACAEAKAEAEAKYIAPEKIIEDADLPEQDRTSQKVLFGMDDDEPVPIPSPSFGELQSAGSTEAAAQNFAAASGSDALTKFAAVPGGSEPNALVDRDAVITLDAEADENGEAHNGLYTITFSDSVELTALDTYVDAFEYYTGSTVDEINEADGFVYGYIHEDGLADGYVLAELTFALKDGEDYGYVIVTVDEANADHPDDTYYYVFRDGSVSSYDSWTWTRLAGANRYKTAAALLEEGFADKSADVIVVAAGASFENTLLGAALAGLYDAPLLITKDGSLPNEIKEEIERVAVKGGATVLLLGDENSVSEDVASAIASIGRVESVERIAGSDAEEMALAIYTAGEGEWGDTAILATSHSFADALSISPYAYLSGSPIFFAEEDGSVSDETLDVLLNFTNIVIVGGTAVVTEEAEKLLGDIGLNVVRLGGETRYDTSALIVEWELGTNTDAAVQPSVTMTVNGMGVATGSNFPDSITSVNVLGKNGGVLLLVKDNVTSIIDEVIGSRIGEMVGGYIFGGTSAVSEYLEEYLNALADGTGK